jgi:hypothetical protein
MAIALAATGGAGQAAAASKHNTDIGVGIRQDLVNPDGSLTYTITAVNDGADLVKNVTITVPFDAGALQPVDWALSQQVGAVSASTPGAIEIKTGALGGNGDSRQATLRFRALAGHSGAGLAERASYTWNDGEGTHRGVSNLPVAAQTILNIGTEGKVATITSAAFGTNEPVTFWYNAPDGRVVGMRIRNGYLLDADIVAAKKAANDRKAHHGVYDQGAPNVFADEQGNVSVQLSTTDLARGSYTIVARGNTSGLIAVGTVDVR